MRRPPIRDWAMSCASRRSMIPSSTASPRAAASSSAGWAAEPGGAAAWAALLSGAYRPAPGERVAVVVCGGNVDLATLTA